MPERPARAGPFASSRLKTPYLLPRPPRNRYLVRQRDRRRMRELLRVAVAVLVVGLALLGYTWLHLEMLAAATASTRWRQLHELERRERHLRLERPTCPARSVSSAASKELGMRRPSSTISSSPATGEHEGGGAPALVGR